MRTGVGGAVFHQQDFDRPEFFGGFMAASLSRSGMVKEKVEPLPGSDSTQMRPPWRSTIFLQMARPMPVPGYSFRVCSRWKMTKMRSKYSGSMPMPLSCTEKTHSPCLAADADVDSRPLPGRGT